jgi:ATP-dependent DNA helicase RecG
MTVPKKTKNYGEAQLLFDFDRPCDIPATLALMTVGEIFRDASQSLLLQLKEDRRIERKSARYSREKLVDYFSMWANTSPDGGIIVLGIENDGAFAGCKSMDQKSINSYENTGHDLCRDARYESRRVSVTNSNGELDFILVFRVFYHSTKVVESHDGKAFVRRGDCKIELKGEEKRLLQVDKGQVSLELEPSELKYPDDFDVDAINKFVASVVKAKNISERANSSEVLINHKLGRMQNREFIPNIACAMLFAKDPRDVVPGSMIRFQRYDGTEMMTGANRNVVKDVPITGTVPQMIEQAAAVISQQVREFSYLKDGKFIRVPEYPPDAWYEALVNACVHRSYDLKNMNIFVRMFDDRLVIESPGPFPPFVTPETIYGIHARRNYWLMDALQFLGLVKCENEGTRRMRDTMKAMELPEPLFEQKEISGAIVRVTLSNNIVGRKPWMSPNQRRSRNRGPNVETLTEGEQPNLSTVLDDGDVPHDAPSPTELPSEIAEQVSRVVGRRADKEGMRLAVLELCYWMPLMPAEIAMHLKRKSVKRILKEYITPLFNEGLLEQTIPSHPEHPAQKYKTSSEGVQCLI